MTRDDFAEDSAHNCKNPELMAFENNVPTGLAVSGNTIFMAEAGPVPHLPETGRVVALESNSMGRTVFASGASLLVDVEFSTIINTLSIPTSLEFIGDTAYVVTLTGEIWKIQGALCPPYGTRR